MHNILNEKTKNALPVITTIIPTFRRPVLLKRALKSALEQDVNGLIVSVFDNHSGDNTADVVQSFKGLQGQVNYHEHENNIGAGNNFEFGLRAVSSPFFSILSDDDYLLPGFYKQALAAFEKNPEIMFWAGTTINIDEQDNIWDALVDRWPLEGIFSPPCGIMKILKGMAPTWTGIVFRREVLSSVGLPDKEALGPSDLDFILKIAAKHPYMVEKYPSAVFTLNTASFSSTQPFSSFWPGWQKMFINIETAIGEYQESDKEKIMLTLHGDAKRMLFRRGANAIAQGRYEFTKDSSKALQEDYKKIFHATLLSLLASICSRLPVAQGFYRTCYQLVEKRIIRKRQEIQAKYKYLIRPL
jgi:glycosyltransferase involved in cell wall biosynthesis